MDRRIVFCAGDMLAHIEMIRQRNKNCLTIMFIEKLYSIEWLNKWKTDLFDHHHGQSIYLRGIRGPIEQQQQKERPYTSDSYHKSRPSKLSFVEELCVISALHINPTCCGSLSSSTESETTRIAETGKEKELYLSKEIQFTTNSHIHKFKKVHWEFVNKLIAFHHKIKEISSFSTDSKINNKITGII